MYFIRCLTENCLQPIGFHLWNIVAINLWSIVKTFTNAGFLHLQLDRKSVENPSWTAKLHALQHIKLKICQPKAFFVQDSIGGSGNFEGKKVQKIDLTLVIQNPQRTDIVIFWCRFPKFSHLETCMIGLKRYLSYKCLSCHWHIYLPIWHIKSWFFTVG